MGETIWVGHPSENSYEAGAIKREASTWAKHRSVGAGARKLGDKSMLTREALFAHRLSFVLPTLPVVHG